MLKDKLVDRNIFETNLKNYIKKVESMKEIIIWGSCGEVTYSFLKAINLSYKIIGYADNDKNKWGGGI